MAPEQGAELSDSILAWSLPGFLWTHMREQVDPDLPCFLDYKLHFFL